MKAEKKVTKCLTRRKLVKITVKRKNEEKKGEKIEVNEMKQVEEI